jgi:hypothetical protein
MNKKRIGEILKELDNISIRYSDDELVIAIYILIRYGIARFESDINNKKLDKILGEIIKRQTLFDDELNYKIDKILDEYD